MLSIVLLNKSAKSLESIKFCRQISTIKHNLTFYQISHIIKLLHLIVLVNDSLLSDTFFIKFSKNFFSLTTFVVKYIILLLLLEVNSFFKIFLFFFGDKICLKSD